jgi:hypothetical protein
MKCKRVQQQLLDYSEELLDQKTHTLIEDHLRTCSDCAQELQDIKKTIFLLQAVPLKEPSDTFWTDFTANVMDKVKKIDTAPVAERLFSFHNAKKTVVAIAVLFFIMAGSIFFYYRGAFQQFLPATTHSTTFAPFNEGTMTIFDLDTSNETVHSLISSLTDEEKNLLLIELDKVK